LTDELRRIGRVGPNWSLSQYIQDEVKRRTENDPYFGTKFNRRYVSKYADKNEAEFMAEAFAMSKGTNPKVNSGHTYANITLEIINEFMRLVGWM
jgi:hypothetical protein